MTVVKMLPFYVCVLLWLLPVCRLFLLKFAQIALSQQLKLFPITYHSRIGESICRGLHGNVTILAGK